MVIVKKVQETCSSCTLPCKPVINSFTASPSCIQLCDEAVLCWTTSGADKVTISPGIGTVPSSGSYEVKPVSTTTYVLTASNGAGSVSASTTVTVSPYTSSLSTTSSTTVASTSAISTAGIGGFDLGLGDDPFKSWPLYVVVIVVLGAAVAAVIIFLTRRPAAAYAVPRTGTRAGFASWDTSTQATTQSPRTMPIDTGAGAKFVTANGEHLPVSGDAMVLGRTNLKSVMMPGNASLISREHVRIECENGEYYIEDVNSTNGTRVNGSRITGKGRFLLSDGDRIELADAITFTFRS